MVRERFISSGPRYQKMALGRNGMGPCGKSAKWSLGEMVKLGEMASGQNEKWAEMKLRATAKGRTDIGRNGKSEVG